MKATTLLATLGLVITLGTNIASAQDISAFDAMPGDTARNALFVELSTGLGTDRRAASLALNYEYQVDPHISARLGVGAAVEINRDYAVGATLGAQFNTSGDHRFEGGVGVSVLYGGVGEIHSYAYSVAPAANMGYRFQPVSGGLVFRLGFSYSYNYGFPTEASAGYSF